MKRRNRSPLYAIFHSPLSFVAAVILCVIVVRAAWGISHKADQGAERLREAQAQEARLEATKATLATKVADLSTPAGIRSELKSRYHAVSPGESVAIIIDRTATAVDNRAAAVTTSVTVSATSTAQISWWQKMLRMIGL